MRRLFLVLSLLLIIPLVSAEIVINEVMYNPEGNDNNKEFIEIFSNEQINLTDYIIEDSKSSDVLELLNYYNSSYALIVEEDFNYSGINASIYSAGATIGNNLNNDEDIIILRDNNSDILDVLHYYDEWGADGNNKSLCLIKNIWQECDSTPGLDNSGSSTSGCDWTISIILNGTVFEDPEFQVRVSKIKGEGKISFTVDKWIESSNGSVSKTYDPWNGEATTKKTSSKYHPNLAEGDAYFIKANITDINCSDTNLSNNFRN